MNRSIFLRVVLGLVLLAAIIGLGAFAYNAGVMQGYSLSAQPPSAELVPPPFAYSPMPYARPFFGFGFLGCLIPLFLLFVIFTAFRGMFWRGPRGWHHMHHGYWKGEYTGKGVPPTVFDEWHRRMHSDQPDESEEG